MNLKTLHDRYVEELKELYSAEHQLLKSQPVIANAAPVPYFERDFTDQIDKRSVEGAS